MNQRQLQAYKKDSIRSELSVADPHRVIQMLMQGALDRLALAKGAMERKDLEVKAATLSRATTIIQALSSSLNMEIGGELSNNLQALYTYMTDRLADASINNDVDAVEEVAKLLAEIKSAWDQIPESAKEEAYSAKAAS
ncbi:flagellar export chaperone FliS [Aliiglaciecola sp. CAU 1673]|uniref:flagellar export chaperone FliS n=1 Tax=Aliiglaciecola sp. CAU 1673 TaxID=3032595 RepID=UPI0023DA0BCC|nr:flagellar export chaperone FliS [Aliiglaciecola sp. CAU 1673]MDF2178312.1 flagellar export chaperone FliS [Aliiglaciecola sp. CAU 1673]